MGTTQRNFVRLDPYLHYFALRARETDSASTYPTGGTTQWLSWGDGKGDSSSDVTNDNGVLKDLLSKSSTLNAVPQSSIEIKTNIASIFMRAFWYVFRA